MSVDPTLERRLEALAGAGTADREGRVLRALSADTLRKRVLRLLDETVMPRVLSLRADGGRSVALDVANGRVGRILTADSAVLPGGEAELVGQPLTMEDESVTARVAGCLERLLEGSATLTVRSEGPGASPEPTQPGPSARAIAEVWGIELAPSDLPEPGAIFDDVLAAVQGKARAWLMLGATPEDSGGAGDQDALDDLNAFAEAWGVGGQAAAATLGLPEGERWSLIALHRTGAAPDLTVIARYDGVHLYLSVPREALGFVADTWRRAVSV
ncbi:hypothetical protein [Ovoidimarina sediminis]|uniref:hypothetical protein n=1 Tax=Ovoidimarina sediminis TaxID=3079856 RepID=UPI0029068D8E|nr:hypothetical protein [Rhodophyticola sp. MJ-SS7]MDU8943353.1 hypothetical protein [Rhodophyticola sp. MJ-SS7]